MRVSLALVIVVSQLLMSVAALIDNVVSSLVIFDNLTYDVNSLFIIVGTLNDNVDRFFVIFGTLNVIEDSSFVRWPIRASVPQTPRNISKVQHTTSKCFKCVAHHREIFQTRSTPSECFERTAHHPEVTDWDVQHTTSKYLAIR